MIFSLTTSQIAELYAHAGETFPSECCGMLLRDTATGAVEVRRCTNVYDQMAAEDPENFPRDSRTAYLIDPAEQVAILKQVDKKTLEIVAFYHSHPEHDAYFSAEDKAKAMMFDEPLYPDAVHVVVSFKSSGSRRITFYRWDEASRDFIEGVADEGTVRAA